ncbi:MAG: FHA domain-containing protein [Anaerolineales bacterium]
MSGIVSLILRILLALALYTFLGWALYTLWDDLRQQGQRLIKSRIPTLVLTKTGQFNQEYPFNQPIVTIGRSPTNDLPINNETISNHHLQINYHLNQWWLNDLNSTNGTFLNSQRIATPTVLTAGDVIGCGEISLLVSTTQES